MRVYEIFTSFQGEGNNQGRRCTFLRLAGCNLDCRWCDTPHARDPGAGIEMSKDEIIDAIQENGVGYVCITGGEPLLQMENLLVVLRTLSLRGYEIEIETNGTIRFDRVQPFASVCMDVKCPSSGEKSDHVLLAGIRTVDSVKFVVADVADLAYADDLLRSVQIAGDVFISPVHGSDLGMLAEHLLSWDHRFRLQLQLHKQIGVR